MNQNYIYLRKRTMETDVYILLLPSRSDVSVSNELLLTSHPLKAEFHKLIFPNAHSAVLESEMGRRVIKAVYEHGCNDAELSAGIADVFSAKALSEVSSSIVLSQDEIKAMRELYSSAESTMHLIATSVAQPQSIKYFAGEGAFVLDTQIGDGTAAKSMSIGHAAELVTSIHAALERFCSVEGVTAELGGAVSAMMIRYRNLSEVDVDEGGDENHLSDFNDSSLSDIDYIVL